MGDDVEELAGLAAVDRVARHGRAAHVASAGVVGLDRRVANRGLRLAQDRRGLLWTLGGLQYTEEVLLEAPDVPADLPSLTEGEAIAWDYELLGLSPGDHPMRLLRPRLAAQHVLTAAELARQDPGKRVAVAGLVVVRQAPPTAKGHLFITLEDETGLANLIIRPDLVEKRRGVLHNATFLLAYGLTQRDGRAGSLLVQEAHEIAQG